MAEVDLMPLNLKRVSCNMGPACAFFHDPAFYSHHIYKKVREFQPDIVFTYNIGAPNSHQWKLQQLEGYHFINSGKPTSLAFKEKAFELKETVGTANLCGAILCSTDVPTVSILCISWQEQFKINARKKVDKLMELINIANAIQRSYSTSENPITAVVIAGTYHLTADIVQSLLRDFQLLTTAKSSDHFLYKGSLAVAMGTPEEKEGYCEHGGHSPALVCFDATVPSQPAIVDRVESEETQYSAATAVETAVPVLELGNTQSKMVRIIDHTEKKTPGSSTDEVESNTSSEPEEKGQPISVGKEDDSTTDKGNGITKLHINMVTMDLGSVQPIFRSRPEDGADTHAKQDSPNERISKYVKEIQPDVVFAQIRHTLRYNWFPRTTGYRSCSRFRNGFAYRQKTDLTNLVLKEHLSLGVLQINKKIGIMCVSCQDQYGGSTIDRLDRLLQLTKYVEAHDELYQIPIEATVIAGSLTVEAYEFIGQIGNFQLSTPTETSKLYFLHKGFLPDPIFQDTNYGVTNRVDHTQYLETRPVCARFAIRSHQQTEDTASDGSSDDDFGHVCFGGYDANDSETED